jgi:quercetin dioxygenase-like cupin family protein
MKIMKIAELAAMKNPTSGMLKIEMLTPAEEAHKFGGHFGIDPGHDAEYHYHQNRESIIIPISGEVVETVEGKEFTIKVGDVVFIPAGEKHGAENRSNQEFRFLEFYTPPGVDIVKI